MEILNTVDRRGELLSKIRELDQDLADTDSEIRVFQGKHFAVVNGRMGLRIPENADPGETRRDVEQTWKRLCERRDAIQKERNEVLSAMARL